MISSTVKQSGQTTETHDKSFIINNAFNILNNEVNDQTLPVQQAQEVWIAATLHF